LNLNKLLIFLAYPILLVLWSFGPFPVIAVSLERFVKLDDASPDDHRLFLWCAGIFFLLIWVICATLGAIRPWFKPLVIVLICTGLLTAIGSTVVVIVAVGIHAAAKIVSSLASHFPAKTYACFISYPTPSPTLKLAIASLEKELTKQEIDFFDPSTVRGRPRRFSKSTVKSAVRNSGFVLMFISDACFESRACQYSRQISVASRRPTLQIIVEAVSAANQLHLQPNALLLWRYLQRAYVICDQRLDSPSRQSGLEELAAEFRRELMNFLSSVCAFCHGHGTASDSRLRFWPYKLRFRCTYCHGTGKRFS
jgi:hypothetical protein